MSELTPEQVKHPIKPYVLVSVALAFLTIVSMRSGLALLNVPGQYMAIIFGLVLIFSILANNIINDRNERKALEKK